MENRHRRRSASASASANDEAGIRQVGIRIFGIYSKALYVEPGEVISDSK